MQIKPLGSEHRAAVDAYVKEEWGGPMVVSKGKLYDSREFPGLVAEEDGRLLGAVLYRWDAPGVCEIAILFALEEGKGVGRALMDAAVEKAREAGCNRVWLVTSNDNTHAMRFYQIYGFHITNIYINSFDRIRELKKYDVKYGIDNIPLEHEVELEMKL